MAKLSLVKQSSQSSGNDQKSSLPRYIHDLVNQHSSPLMILDCQKIRDQYEHLCNALPGVEHFYSVKALSHPSVINTLKQLEAKFDAASSGELELLANARVHPRDVIHTHPIKKVNDIRVGLRFGCTTFVVDNAEELKKFRRYRNRVGLLLRVGFPNMGARIDLAKKFGCAINEVPHLLTQARQLGLHIKGISFHVGSQAATADAYVQAIEACLKIIQQDYGLGNTPLNTLDIGGGFPTDYDGKQPSIDTFCAPIRKALKKLPNDLQVIAEPGRFIAAPAMLSVSTIIGKAKRNDRQWYYLDDGIYGSYSGCIFDHANYPLSTQKDNGKRYPSVLAGPTCDSIDVIDNDLLLPDLNIGDLIVGRLMGAYTSACATEFNSIVKTKIVALNETPIAEAPIRSTN